MKTEMKHSDHALLLQKRLCERVPRGLPAPFSSPRLDASVGRASEDQVVRARLLGLMEHFDLVARFDGALEDVYQGEGETMGLLGFAWSTHERGEKGKVVEEKVRMCGNSEQFFPPTFGNRSEL